MGTALLSEMLMRLIHAHIIAFLAVRTPAEKRLKIEVDSCGEPFP